MKINFLIIFVIGILGFCFTDFIIPSVDAHSLGSQLLSHPLRFEDETFDKVFMQTGETLTIGGILTNSDESNIKGWLSMFSESSNSNNRWEMLARDPPSVVFDIPGNSVIEYSLSAKVLEAGTYHIHTQFNIDKEGPRFSAGETIVVTGDSISTPIAFTSIAYELIPIGIGFVIVIIMINYFWRKRK